MFDSNYSMKLPSTNPKQTRKFSQFKNFFRFNLRYKTVDQQNEAFRQTHSTSNAEIHRTLKNFKKLLCFFCIYTYISTAK